MPEPLALGALHPTAAGLRLSRRQVRPELGLCHGQQGRGRNREVVVVVVLRLVRRLVLRLRRRLVLRRSQWSRRGGGAASAAHFHHVGRGYGQLTQITVSGRRRGHLLHGPFGYILRSRVLETRLGVRGQKRLSRARQEGLSRRHEGPCGCGPWLAKVKKAHRPRRLEGWPGRPLSGEHRLLSLLIKRWPRLGEGQGAGRGHRVTTAKKRGRRRWWRGTSLFQEEMARESWFS